MKDGTSKFEKNENWQATARRKDGQTVAIMRAADKGPKFYLYDSDFRFTPNAAPPPGFEGPSYSAAEIKAMFASGELSLLKGEIPK